MRKLDLAWILAAASLLGCSNGGGGDGDGDVDGAPDGGDDGGSDGGSDGGGGDGGGDSAPVGPATRVLFLIDSSASLTLTDPDGTRQALVEGALSTLAARGGDVEVGALFFNSRPYPVEFGPLASNRFTMWGVADAGADIQGALASAHEVLVAEAAAMDGARRARTTFEVILMGDGMAAPRCEEGCEDDPDRCSDSEDNDGDELVDGDDPDCSAGHPDRLYTICNAGVAPEAGQYVDWPGDPVCPGYNRTTDYQNRIRQLLDLQGVAAVRLSTVLVFQADPGPGGNPEASAVFYQGLATLGGGASRDTRVGETIDFL